MIKVEHLSKDYGNHKGIFDLCFEVKEGEVFGFLGPNGAGKTTTIRHLLGLTNADKGSASIMGFDSREASHHYKNDLGYCPGEIALYDEMTGNEFLDFVDALRAKKNKELRVELIHYFELDVSRKIRKMSKGMKQKLALIASFMHDPKVLILDEPSSGLDPLMQKKFIEYILKLKAQGKTILMSSHQFEEVERTCDRIAIIKDGRLVNIEETQMLKAKAIKQYIISLKDEASIKLLIKEGFDLKRINSHQVVLSLHTDLDKLIKILSKCQVESLDSVSQSLEDIFIGYYGKEEEV